MKTLTDGAMAVGAQAFGGLLSFLVQLTFARVLGPFEYGLFAYFVVLATMAGVWSRLGSDMVMQRIGGQAIASGKLHVMWSVLGHSQVVTLSGGFVGAIVVGVLALVTGLAGTRVWLPVVAGMLVIAVGIAGVRQAALLALSRTLEALGPDLLLKPCIVLAAIGIASWSGFSLQAESALATIVFGATGAVLVSGLLIVRATPVMRASKLPMSVSPGWTRLGLTLMFASASYMLFYNSDTLVLGYILEPESVGTYQVAKQISQVGFFAMVAIQHVFAARISGLVSNNDWAQVRRLYFSIARTGAVFAGFALLLFWIVGDTLIELFGPGYGEAYATVRIMLSFQLFIAILGPVGTFALMSGRQRMILIGYGMATLVVIAGVPAAVRYFGINGAAYIHGISAVLCATVLCIGTWRSFPADDTRTIRGSPRDD